MALTALRVAALLLAYGELGLGRRAVALIALGVVAGSWIDLPIAPGRPSRTPPTVLAVNVGGALVPGATAAYELAHLSLWRAAVATAVVPWSPTGAPGPFPKSASSCATSAGCARAAGWHRSGAPAAGTASCSPASSRCSSQPSDPSVQAVFDGAGAVEIDG